MAYMRGTYYVYKNINGGVDIHVGGVVSEQEYPDAKSHDSALFIEEYEREAVVGHVRLPVRVMEELAAKFWLEMPEEKRHQYRKDPRMQPYLLRSRS